MIGHGNRRVRILGATEHPVQSWVAPASPEPAYGPGDAGARAKFVLHDRDASFTHAFDAVFQAACRRELLDRTLIWNQRHLMMVLREYEDFCNSHQPHRTLNQAGPLRPLPDGVTDLDHFQVRRHDRAGGVIHEYYLVA